MERMLQPLKTGRTSGATAASCRMGRHEYMGYHNSVDGGTYMKFIAFKQVIQHGHSPLRLENHTK
ncbi:hypothetical protein BV455_04034 (plasmid) [Parageobacillus caldoxylosilyticus]|nr:hypothetical protein BV455_04034 [Parageobacillus caldoxylosilyticus]